MAIEVREADLLGALREVLEREVERVLGEEAELAAQRCRVRVQDEVGRIALACLSEYRVFMQGRDELHIVVKIDPKGGKA